MKINLEELIENGIISETTAVSIEQYYSEQHKSNPNRLLLIFAVLGSLLIGAGIILIIGHNWDSFPRWLKTGLSFLPLIIAQAIAAYTILKKYDNPIWREASAVILFFAIGASISLVSQVYHIVGDLKSFLLTWIVLAIPIIYLLKSKAALLLVIAFLTSYGQQVGYLYKRSIPYYYWLLVGALVPFIYQIFKSEKTSHSLSFILWAFLVSITLLLGTFETNFSPVALCMYMSYFGLLYLIGIWYRRYTHSFIQNPFIVIACLGTVIFLFISSFQGFWESVSESRNAIQFTEISTYVWISLTLLATALFIFLLSKNKLSLSNPLNYSFLLFIIIYCLSYIDPFISVFASNLLLLLIGLSLIWRGNRELDLRLLNVGLAIIVILIIARFFDFKISFIVRGIIFVMLGIGFFLANYALIKKRKEYES